MKRLLKEIEDTYLDYMWGDSGEGELHNSAVADTAEELNLTVGIVEDALAKLVY